MPSFPKIETMKKIYLAILMGMISLAGMAQNVVNPYPKTITVTGSAEMDITPDEIWATVTLREYEKKGGSKVNIETIKQQFLQNAKALGIADTAITIASYEGYNGNPWLRKKNKKVELMASITYQIKIAGSKQMDELVNRLDDNATQNFSIDRTSHSKMEAFRRQLKMAAVKAAKEKAIYLAEAIGESVGTAVTINEPTEYFMPMYAMRSNKMMVQSTEAAADIEVAQPDFKKMKLKYDVTVVFALK
ncbi:MAG: hypothetical protein JWP88_1308 [Flaviaesturariibacter sp.]|nr:hypothetical protein [Flaviaesturariibacter sp.]